MIPIGSNLDPFSNRACSFPSTRLSSQALLLATLIWRFSCVEQCMILWYWKRYLEIPPAFLLPLAYLIRMDSTVAGYLRDGSLVIDGFQRYLCLQLAVIAFLSFHMTFPCRDRVMILLCIFYVSIMPKCHSQTHLNPLSNFWRKAQTLCLGNSSIYTESVISKPILVASQSKKLSFC